MMLITLARRCRGIFAVPTIVQQLYGSTFVSIRGSIAVSAKGVSDSADQVKQLGSLS